MTTKDKASPDQFIFGDLLGEGTYAKVYESIHKTTGNKVAIKTVNKDFIKRNKKVETVLRERNVLRALNSHPGVTKLYFTFQDQTS